MSLFVPLLEFNHSRDYSVVGQEDSFAIERKSVEDLVNCCLSGQRERFEHELHRLRGYRFKRLVIVGSRDDIAAGRYRSRIGPKSVVGHVPGFKLLTADGALGAAEVAWFPGLVQGAEGVAWKVWAGGGVDGIGAIEGFR